MLKYYADQESLPSTFPNNSIMLGRVQKVFDGDTLLFTPMTLFSLFNQKQIQKSKISLRLAGIDAPETAKKGKEGQPFSMESMEFLSQTLNKIILIKPFSKDQYGRLVGMAFDFPLLVPWIKRNLSVESVRKGLSVVYRGIGSEYGDLSLVLMNAQDEASRKKIGVWSLKSFESPGQFKRNHQN
jgi:micrococcal nuclease